MPLSRYIVNPVPPGSVIDRLAGDPGKQCDDNWPDGACPDGTAVNDGWAVFSGTSAAAAHVAGVAALVKSANRALGRADVFDILKSTATPVAAGIPSSGSHGQLLVDAEAAVKAAKARAPATAA
jgi:subtilisin family serine protease